MMFLKKPCQKRQDIPVIIDNKKVRHAGHSPPLAWPVICRMSGSANLFLVGHNPQSCIEFGQSGRENLLHQLPEEMSAVFI